MIANYLYIFVLIWGFIDVDTKLNTKTIKINFINKWHKRNFCLPPNNLIYSFTNMQEYKIYEFMKMNNLIANT